MRAADGRRPVQRPRDWTRGDCRSATLESLRDQSPACMVDSKIHCRISRCFVLQVTYSALAALGEARAAQGVPDSFGVRVFTKTRENGQATVALAFAEHPAEGDQVIQRGNTEIYVAPELAKTLSSSMLDVEDTQEGPKLTLVPQHDEE